MPYLQATPIVGVGKGYAVSSRTGHSCQKGAAACPALAYCDCVTTCGWSERPFLTARSIVLASNC